MPLWRAKEPAIDLFLGKRFALPLFFERSLIEVTPRRVFWWDDGDPEFLSDPGVLDAALDRQGRGELLAWALRRNRPLACWLQLQHAPEDVAPAHLPEKALLVVVSHHEGRDGD